MTDTEEDMVLCGRGLDKWYGAKHDRRQVLFGVDVDVCAGECLAVIGGSGSGKTTLTRVLLERRSEDELKKLLDKRLEMHHSGWIPDYE